MQQDRSYASEWRAHWPVVLAAMAGMSFVTIASSSVGLFMQPLHQALGLSRAQIASGLSVNALVAAPLSPFVGALIDRFGSRRLAIPGIVLTAFAFAAFSLADGSMARWISLWIVYSLAAMAIRAPVWTAAVSSLFSAGRGLALAFTLSGIALTLTLAPPAARWAIDTQGWRQAYVWIGLGWGGAVLVLLLFCFFDARDRRTGASAEASRVAAPLTGLSVAEAMRSVALFRIGAATLIASLALSAMAVHQVPMLTDAGFSRGTAALMAGAGGLASFAGKLIPGFLFDRWRSGWIGAGSLAAPAISCLLLQGHPGLYAALAAVLILGFATGAVTQVCAYLTSRYGGVRNFGKIFGVMASLLAVALGVGPVLAGLIFDRFGDYSRLLLAAAPALLASGGLLLGLGAYPQWRDGAEAETAIAT